MIHFDKGLKATKDLKTDVLSFESFTKDCKILTLINVIHSDEGLRLETSAFKCFTVANLPYRPCG